jgi:hypothetical protein
VRVRKIPTQIVLIVLMAAASKTGRYAALCVESVHGVQPLAEAAGRHSNLDDVRELPLKGFPAQAAFVATHSTIFYHARCGKRSGTIRICIRAKVADHEAQPETHHRRNHSGA